MHKRNDESPLNLEWALMRMPTLNIQGSNGRGMDQLKPQKESIIWPIIIITTGLSIYAITQYVNMERSVIMNNWPEYRCSLPVMMGAYWLKPDLDPRSSGQFASENFQFCLKEVSQNVMKVVLAPLMSTFGKQADITKLFTEVLNSIKTVIKKMYDEFLSFMDPFFRRFNAVAHQIGIVTQKLRAAFERLNTALLTIVFSGLTIVKGINNAVQFVIKVVLIILAIMVALIIILFFILFPFIPLIITPVLLAIIGIGAAAGAEAASDQDAFCFTGYTPVVLADGSTIPISELTLGARLEGGATVEGILTLEGDNTPLYSLDGIRVSGSHLVKHEQGWHAVAKDSRATPIQERVSKLYCLNTSNQTIPIRSSGGTSVLFRDWEEIDGRDAVGQVGWNKLISQMLGGLEHNKGEAPFCLMDPSILIPTPNGHKTLREMQLGDSIELSYNHPTRVIGIVEGLIEGGGPHHWLNGCIEKTYTPTVGPVYRRVTTITPAQSILKGRHLITDSGLLIAYVNGTVMHLRDFTEVGISRIHETYPFVATRLSSFAV
jgi:hypothetical protein